jgi:hypothetical protein
MSNSPLTAWTPLYAAAVRELLDAAATCARSENILVAAPAERLKLWSLAKPLKFHPDCLVEIGVFGEQLTLRKFTLSSGDGPCPN